MPKIEGIEKVLQSIQSRVRASQNQHDVSVIVGYTQAYAIYVHENLEAHHPIGQAKFLEQPARELAGELAEIVKGAIRQGKTLSQALLIAGLRLQRESQLLVPVDTGALKGSAFTRLEEK